MATTLSLLGISIPNFWLGPLLAIVFSIELGWLPVSGRGTWAHLVLPANVENLYFLDPSYSQWEALDAVDYYIIGYDRGTRELWEYVYGTGNELDVPFVHVWTLRDGKAVRFRQFLDTAGWNEALTRESGI